MPRLALLGPVACLALPGIRVLDRRRRRRRPRGLCGLGGRSCWRGGRLRRLRS